MHVPDARNRHLVGLYGGRRSHRPGGEAQVADHRLEASAVRIGNEKSAGTELAAVELEILFGRQHLHVLILIAKGHEVVIRRVLDDERATAALDSSGRL